MYLNENIWRFVDYLLLLVKETTTTFCFKKAQLQLNLKKQYVK